jgi:hypothetical protein
MISINDILDYFENNHKEEIKTLKELSIDTNDRKGRKNPKDRNVNYLTEKIQHAYNFDEIAGEGSRSCDAVFISTQKNCLYFIEFKNQSCVNAKGDSTTVFNVDLRLKAVESLNVLYIKLKQNGLLKNRCEMCKVRRKLIVVYSEEKTNFKIDISHRSRALSLTGYKFQVHNYQDYLYDNVVVIPNTKFEDYELK